MAKETIKVNEEKQKKIFIIAVVVIVILSLLLIISRNFGTFDNVRIRKNNKTIFSVTDLTINDLKFSDNEEKIKDTLGKPKKEEKITKDKYNYKKLQYDGLKLTLKENYDDYILVGVEVSSRKYKISRNIKVKDSIANVMRKFKVENTNGTYLYGNYSADALGSEEITDSIYFGVRNTNEVVYINKDASIGDMSSNIAKLNIAYKHGKVTKVTWSYDYE